MSISLKKISKLIDLDLSDIPKEKRKTVKKEIGDFVVEEILIAVSKGQSPVIGEKRNFKKLKPDYAKAEKGGDRNPDLELLGDMLDSLTFKNTTKGIEVGIFKATEVPKAVHTILLDFQGVKPICNLVWELLVVRSPQMDLTI